VKDPAGRPIRGAEVQYAVVNRNDRYSSWAYMPANHIRGTAVGKGYLATTDATGAFRFTAVPAGAELFFRASAPGYGDIDTAGPPRQHVAGPNAKPAELVLEPEAVVRGRVASKVPGVAVKDVTVRLNGRAETHDLKRTAKPDADGRFEFRGLRAGQYGVFLALPESAAAAAAGASPALKAGETADVALEVVAGVGGHRRGPGQGDGAAPGRGIGHGERHLRPDGSRVSRPRRPTPPASSASACRPAKPRCSSRGCRPGTASRTTSTTSDR